MTYSAYVLDDEIRHILLKFHTAKYDDVILHHITHEFPSNELPPEIVTGPYIVGYAYDDKVEAFVVQINGTIYRPDNKIYHITISVNREKGGKPVHSNKLLHKQDWMNIDNIPIDVKRAILGK